MDRTEILQAAREMLATNGARAAQLLQTLPTLSVPLGGGSVWTVRDAAVHVAAGSDLYTDIATGVPSPLASLTQASLAEFSAQRIADVAETEPTKVAAMVSAGVERFLEVTEGWSATQETPWHGGVKLDLADLTALLAADVLVHGYDMACAVGAPWPIEREQALLAAGAYAPLLHLVLNPATAAGHTAAYELTLLGGPSLILRFVDGVLALEPPGAEVDCAISADPVAFLLVFTGRLSRWPAISLGLICASGPRPELALGFPDLFVYP